MSDADYWKRQYETTEAARLVWIARCDKLKDALTNLANAAPSGDELRLLCVATNGPAMSDPKNANGRALHAQCDRLTKAHDSARKALKE